MIIEFDCPKCEEHFEVIVERHHGETICPHCNIELYIDYDEYCNEDYSDCWDYHILSLLSESCFTKKDHLSFFQSNVISTQNPS